jgi:OOP family OmpA-OmpF porin
MPKRKIAIAVAALAFSSLTFAQGYVGLSAGDSSSRFSAGSTSPGVGTITQTGDQRKTGYKLFAGYDFTPNWGTEAGYADFGKPDYSFNDANGVPGSAEAKETAWYLAGKGMLPVNPQFDLFAKLGASRNKLQLASDSSKTDLLAGVGAEYKFNKQAGLRLEYEDFGKFGSDSSSGQTKVNMWSLGLDYRFSKF